MQGHAWNKMTPEQQRATLVWIGHKPPMLDKLVGSKFKDLPPQVQRAVDNTDVGDVAMRSEPTIAGVDTFKASLDESEPVVQTFRIWERWATQVESSLLDMQRVVKRARSLASKPEWSNSEEREWDDLKRTMDQARGNLPR